MSEFTQNVKALITTKGGTVTAAEGLETSDIKQFVEIAQLYYGVGQHVALMGLAYPESLPANLVADIDAGAEDPEEGEPEGEGAGIQSFAMGSADGDLGDDSDINEDPVGGEDAPGAEDEPEVTEPAVIDEGEDIAFNEEDDVVAEDPPVEGEAAEDDPV